jgi:WD repeat-containing protein 23
MALQSLLLKQTFTLESSLKVRFFASYFRLTMSIFLLFLDSSFYYTCSQGNSSFDTYLFGLNSSFQSDFELRIYDMTAPPQKPPLRFGPGRLINRQDSAIKLTKSIQGSPGRWTITDSHLSPDNERMIYSSITPTIHMTSTVDPNPTQIPLRFADPPQRQSRTVWGYDEESFGIYSCRFSADGNEVVAGGSGKIFVYDLLADRRTVKIAAHSNDVNSCCWADTASGNILVSASDDTFIKVWYAVAFKNRK